MSNEFIVFFKFEGSTYFAFAVAVGGLQEAVAVVFHAL